MPRSRVSSPRNTWTAACPGPRKPTRPRTSHDVNQRTRLARMPGVEFPGEICARRLQDLIRPAQLTDFPFQLGDPFPILHRDAGPLPESTSALFTQLRSVSVLMPSRCPTRVIEPRASPDSARSSKTICTARSRSSAGYDFLDIMNPNFPRGHSLQGTRAIQHSWIRKSRHVRGGQR
jgi:hypothetical protein